LPPLRMHGEIDIRSAALGPCSASS
jgi:hypothetical protein